MSDTQGHRGDGFVIGVVTGALVGAGLAWYLTPRRPRGLRTRVRDLAERVRRGASARSQAPGAPVADATDDLARKGRGVRHAVADTVAQTARDVE